MNSSKAPMVGILCFLITTVILMIGLWPFNFKPANNTERLRKEKGIQFYGRGIVFSQKPIFLSDTATGNVSVTIEILVRPNRESDKTSASILTLYDNNQDLFIFSQWKTNFNIRVPAAKSENQQPYRYLGIVNALPRDRTPLITVTSRKDQTDIYVNGKLAESAPHYTLIPNDQGASGYLVLGNSPEGKHPWKGSILGMAIYGRTLNSKEVLDHYEAWRRHRQPFLSEKEQLVALYLFDEHCGERIRDYSGAGNHLQVSTTFRPLRRTFLHVLEKDRWFLFSNLLDVTINILGFVPCGFFFSAWLLRSKYLSAPRAYGITVLIGFGLSLAIELTQAYLPSRDSSLPDLINNTLGTAAGTLLFHYGPPALHKNSGGRMVRP